MYKPTTSPCQPSYPLYDVYPKVSGYNTRGNKRRCEGDIENDIENDIGDEDKNTNINDVSLSSPIVEKFTKLLNTEFQIQREYNELMGELLNNASGSSSESAQTESPIQSPINIINDINMEQTTQNMMQIDSYVLDYVCSIKNFLNDKLLEKSGNDFDVNVSLKHVEKLLSYYKDDAILSVFGKDIIDTIGKKHCVFDEANRYFQLYFEEQQKFDEYSKKCGFLPCLIPHMTENHILDSKDADEIHLYQIYSKMVELLCRYKMEFEKVAYDDYVYEVLLVLLLKNMM